MLNQSNALYKEKENENEELHKTLTEYEKKINKL